MEKTKDKPYNPQVAGMVLRQAFCMLERIGKDNVETERRREILRQWELERKEQRKKKS